MLATSSYCAFLFSLQGERYNDRVIGQEESYLEVSTVRDAASTLLSLPVRLRVHHAVHYMTFCESCSSFIALQIKDTLRNARKEKKGGEARPVSGALPP